MLELFGSDKKRFDLNLLKRVHKANGILYFILFLLLSFSCVYYMMKTGGELSPRGAFHYIIAQLIFILFFIKIVIIKFYKLHFNMAKNFGFSIVIFSFLLFGSSGGFMFFKNNDFFAQTNNFKEEYKTEDNISKATQKVFILRTDSESVKKGLELFQDKCSFCHSIVKDDKSVGPSLFNLMKKKQLDSIKKPPTTANIFIQLKNPVKEMPSFDCLSDEELSLLLAYLNTI